MHSARQDVENALCRTLGGLIVYVSLKEQRTAHKRFVCGYLFGWFRVGPQKLRLGMHRDRILDG